MSEPLAATAVAGTNIALVKYWGKRDAALNLPAVGSLSLTLAGLTTRTDVAFDPDLAGDELHLDGAAVAGRPLERVSGLLDPDVVLSEALAAIRSRCGDVPRPIFAK